MTSVAVCPICHIAGCYHIWEASAAASEVVADRLLSFDARIHDGRSTDLMGFYEELHAAYRAGHLVAPTLPEAMRLPEVRALVGVALKLHRQAMMLRGEQSYREFSRSVEKGLRKAIAPFAASEGQQ